MKKCFYMLSIIVFIHVLASNLSPHHITVLYKSALGFEVELPQWDMAEMVKEDSSEIICAHTKYVYIKITKRKSINDDILHWYSWKIWDTDPNAHFILTSKSSDGAIIVATYRTYGNFIHRIRIYMQHQSMFIVECSASEKIFYNYEYYFNKALHSFKLL